MRHNLSRSGKRFWYAAKFGSNQTYRASKMLHWHFVPTTEDHRVRRERGLLNNPSSAKPRSCEKVIECQKVMRLPPNAIPPEIWVNNFGNQVHRSLACQVLFTELDPHILSFLENVCHSSNLGSPFSLIRLINKYRVDPQLNRKFVSHYSL